MMDEPPACFQIWSTELRPNAKHRASLSQAPGSCFLEPSEHNEYSPTHCGKCAHCISKRYIRFSSTESVAPSLPRRHQQVQNGPCCNISPLTQRRLELLVKLLLLSICTIPCVSSVSFQASSRVGSSLSVETARVTSNHKTKVEDAAFLLMQHQLEQFERQKVLEEVSIPLVSTEGNRNGTGLRGKVPTTDAPELPLAENGLEVLGLPPTRDSSAGKSANAEALDPPENGESLDASPQTAFSFINWGQVGGLMQSPALAHTGMPVRLPRQVVGTTVGLDFDSPATFHGPLLVLLMSAILVFFVVLMLCCLLVRSKQKHDKFMAEKVPK